MTGIQEANRMLNVRPSISLLTFLSGVEYYNTANRQDSFLT